MVHHGLHGLHFFSVYEFNYLIINNLVDFGQKKCKSSLSKEIKQKARLKSSWALIFSVSGGLNSFRFDTCGFTGQIAQVKQFSAANFAVAVHFDLVDIRGIDREYTLNTNAV